MADFNTALQLTLKNEGGDKYTETPDDNGGATKYGISLRFYKTITVIGSTKLLYPNATAEDIKNLTLDDATWIYKNCFWNPNRYGDIDDQRIANKAFDMCVLMGQYKVNIFVQHVINSLYGNFSVKEDGLIGDETIKKLNSISGKIAYLIEFKMELVNYFLSICNKNKSQRKFLLDWLNRVMS